MRIIKRKNKHKLRGGNIFIENIFIENDLTWNKRKVQERIYK